MICYLFEAPKYLFFATEVPQLLYYSHIPAAILSLLVGIFVFVNAPQKLLNRLLFLVCLSFSMWVLVSLTAWTNVESDFLIFSWSFFGVFASLISVFSIYFISVFVSKDKNTDITVKTKLVLILLLAPVLFFAHTNLSLTGFNLVSCDAFEYEGLLFKFYTNLLGVLAMIWIFYILVKAHKRADSELKKQILLLGVGIEFFLLLFFSLTFLASYLTTLGYFEDSRYELYGLFGMVFFMIMISVLIVRFKTFNVVLTASRALVIAIIILIASQYTYANSTTTTIVLTSVTLLLSVVSSYFLLRSVQKEITQREQIEKLAADLSKANDRLKELDKLKSEFVSIASHQLRSPLTSIRGYASMLVEESFGKLPEKALEPLKRIDDSARLMAMSIEDYLNVSRIEAGNMKYNMSEFNLRDEVEKVSDDVRPVAMEKGLVLLFRTDMNSKGIVKADIGKTVQIVHNLINNSMKYTPKGSITVLVHDNVQKKRIYVDIIDTGIGINKENLARLFQKFSRADNANTVNVAGTGLGLFVALRMAEAMGGNITAHSDGDGKGSKFTLELPLAL